MSYEDYIKKHQQQIDQAKKALESPVLKQTLEYVKSEEFKKSMKKIKEQEKLIHKNIIETIETLQNNLIRKV